MPEALEDVRFPRQGHTYTPLPRDKDTGRVQAHAVQTIAATPEQVFKMYTRIELLPTWQEGVIAVERTGDRTLHWKMEDPGTRQAFEFESEELEVIPGVRHVSRVTSGPLAGSTNTLQLAPHPASRGTIATQVSDYVLPGGLLSHAVTAVVSRSPSQVTIENLRHLKELIEAGEIPSVEGQPTGPRGVIGALKRFLLGENLPTPPGTSERAKLRDMPRGLVEGGLSAQTMVTVGLIAVPLIFGAVLWASLSDHD